jgi:2-polyprenyl-6-methoxyphenol hydroxylase-like FAD-dependent oxidoreductase
LITLAATLFLAGQVETGGMMKPIGQHAVVIGASMGGLLAARALADFYEQVTVLERDMLPPTAEQRKGVPQGKHTHILLARGREVIESFFPKFTQELVAQGAVYDDIREHGRWYQSGGYHCQFKSGLRALGISRPLLEFNVRARILSLPNVRITGGCDVLGLAATPDNSRVTGVRLISRQVGSAEEIMEADLVVDASGRGSRTAAWLEALGYTSPEVQEVRVNVIYASRIYRRKPEHLGGQTAVLIAASPENPRGGVLVAQENDQWIVTVFGYFHHKPPTDEQGFLEFVRTLDAPDIYHVIRDAEPLGDIIPATMPVSQRRCYENLTCFPEGFLVTADSICSFNPIYGQGMTVAALEAVALQTCLAEGTQNLARRFLQQAGELVDTPWQIAVGNDLRMPQVEGKRTARTKFIHWYLSKLHVAARHDPAVALAFHHVTNLIAPPASLLRPQIALRVLRGNLRPRHTTAPIFRETAKQLASV